MPATGYTGVTNFLSGTQYRASGSMKHTTYGNSVQLDLTYNSRMQIGQYQMSSPNFNIGVTMSYYNDGRTNTAFDSNDSRFDRKYEFDFSARLKEAYSGVEAHGAPPPPLNQANSPYRQSYTYDEWNNATLRTGRIWSVQNEYDGAGYGSDNKRSGFGYDFAGNVTSVNNDGTRTYDAAGRPVTYVSEQQWQVYPNWPAGHPNAPALETQDTFDGTGQVVKHLNHVRHDDSYDAGYGLIYVMSDATTTTYYLHSTVLGGKTIEELDQNGVKARGYVYAGGTRIATQTFSGGSSEVQIESTNPVTGAAILTDANGAYVNRQEPDPLGRDLTTQPDLTVAVDPIPNPKWEEPRPIEYAAHWTGELEIGMAQYLNTMQMIEARYAFERWLKSEKTSNIDYNIWQNILSKNPNVGIVAGKKTYWGAAAAAFLEAKAGSIFLGAHGIMLTPQKPGQTPCHIMADVAQNIANSALAYAHYTFEDKKGVNYDGLEANMAIRDFDAGFSYTYHGGPLRTLNDAWRWRGGTGRHINPTYPYVGGAGFRSDFKDSGTETYGGPDADQTHHFSAYLSLGINALWPVAKYHEWGDNTGDQNLARAAYYLGEQIRKGNFQLKNIGQYIRENICSGPGRGLY